MLERLKDLPAVRKLIAQYDHLPRRDQQALGLLTIALLIGLVYFALWRPVVDYHDEGVRSRENASELLAWLQANRQTLNRLSGTNTGQSSSGSKPQSGRELMALVTRTAGESGLALQRFEPSGEDAIRVWIDGVPFSQVASWLEMLGTNNGVEIEQASMDRQSEPGRVSVRLTLTI